MIIYETNAGLYSGLAQRFYDNYKLCCTKNEINSKIAMEEYAIQTIIFQALAIEAYINLFGVFHYGEKKYREEIDTTVTKNGREYHPSTLNKLKTMIDMMGKEYPQDHLKKLQDLFSLRNQLVHHIPKTCNVEREMFLSDDLSEVDKFRDFVEKSYLYKDIDESMNLYEQLVEYLKILSSDSTGITSKITRGLVKSIDTIFPDVIDTTMTAGINKLDRQ